MFNTISWHSYWTTLAICLAIYYPIIFLLYYRKELKFSFQKRLAGEVHSFDPDEEAFQMPTQDSDEGVVYACMDEVNAFFEEAKKRKWGNDEMIRALQMIMNKYPSIEGSGYKQSVTNVLRNQCEHNCGIKLTNEELDRVW
jgi:hypothetical protein